ncbi:hypothetical protein CbuD7D7780_08750 [Coxiella burnetii]|uniref:Wall-associated protein n=1 Tax=Coxiella burnetii (strain Dugway 5J108-111) TaxID=434922 RepID=B5XHI2_COXBN|nr:wall-associated protein precursor [Coxiella burnetii]ACI23202.1 wall-associated protein precursor [Coxiella burnetii Dugway 5J108-111]OYK81653.1 hypothetical protein CbuD7D7780_08750 [Coxiella burnetii]
MGARRPNEGPAPRLKRNGKGHITEQFLPAFRYLKPGTAEPFQTALTIGTQFPDFGQCSLSWPAPAEIFWVAQLTLDNTDGNSPPQIFTPVKKTIGGQDRLGIDITAFTADRYTFVLTYYYQDPDTKIINPNPVKEASGTITLDTSHTENARHLAAKFLDDSTVLLTGKTEGVLGVALLQGDTVVSKAGLSSTAVPGRYTIPLDDQVSGEYSFVPITSSSAVDEPLTLDQVSAKGNQVVFRQTIVDGTFEFPLGYMFETSWAGLPPHCERIQLVVDVLVESSYKEIVKTLDASVGHFTWGGWIPFLTPSNRLYALDKKGKPWYLGDAANPTLSDKTKIPPYLYFIPKDESVIPDYLSVIDASGHIVRTAALTEWMDGMYRAGVSGLPNPQQFHYQPFALSGPNPQTKPLLSDTLHTAKLSPRLLFRQFCIPDFTLERFYEVFQMPYTYFHWSLPKDRAMYPMQLRYQSSSEAHRFLGNGYAPLWYIGQNYPYGNLSLDLWLDNQWVTVFSGEPIKSVAPSAYYHVNALVMQSLPAEVKSAKLEYLEDTGDERAFLWRSLTATLVGQTLVADVNSLNSGPGLYRYRLQLLDSEGRCLPLHQLNLSPSMQVEAGWITGSFSVKEYAGDELACGTKDAYEWSYPTRAQTVDRWGNVLETKDELGNITNYAYNTANKPLTQTAPPVDYTDERGIVHPADRSMTRYGYDAMHQPIAEQSPAGGVTAHWRNQAGEVIKSVRPDGVWEEKEYDGLGRHITIKDAKRATNFEYDAGDRLIATTDAMGWVTRYTYNERNQHQSRTNPAGETMRFDYDERDREVLTVQPGGQKRLCHYDRAGELLSEDDGEGPPLTWTRDPFGHARTHTDKGNATVRYKRNHLQQVTAVNTTQAGDHGTQFVWLDKDHKQPVPSAALRYLFDEAGHLIWALDDANQLQTRYRIEASGRTIGERFIDSDGQVRQDTLITRDAKGRITAMEDVRMAAKYTYDQNDNRRSTQIWYKQLSAEPGGNTHRIAIDNATNWFAYNAADVMTIDRGVLDPTTHTIGLAPGKGTELRYDEAGWRQTERTLSSSGAAQDTTIRYYVNGLVKSTAAPGKIVTYKYDQASRRTGYQVDTGQTTTVTTTTYNANGWVTSQSEQKQTSPIDPLKPQYETHYETFNAEGEAKLQETWTPEQSNWELYDNLPSKFVGFDRWQIKENKGTETRKGGEYKTYGTVYVTYDANGNYQSVSGDLQDKESFRWFRVNQEGRVVYKENAQGEEYFIYDPNGDVLGWVGDLPSDPTSSQVPTKVNFDPLYHNVSEQWPPPMPSQYTAQAGDTFESIAQALYGDPDFDYIIAQANGYSPGDAVPLGMVLTIPQFTITDTHNKAGEFVPYNPGAIIGTLYPYMPIPPRKPPPPVHDHFFAELLEFFVGALIMAFAPELEGALLGLFGTSLAGEMLSGALAYGIMSATADVVEQTIGIIAGVQTHFSWKEVALQLEQGAITGALTGALQAGGLLGRAMAGEANSLFAGAQQSAGAWRQLGMNLLDNEMLTVGGELALMATGQKKRFNWKDVLNTLVQTAINAGSAKAAHNLFPTARLEARWLSDLLNGELGDFFSAELYKDHFDPAISAARAMGVYAGQRAAQAVHTAYQHHRESQMREKAEAEALYRAWRAKHDETPEDMSAEFFAQGSDANGANPQSSNNPMGGSTSPPHNPPRTSKDPSFFARQALDGSKATLSAPQLRKEARNEAAATKDWAAVKNRSLQDTLTSQMMAGEESKNVSPFRETLQSPVTWMATAFESGEHLAPQLLQRAQAGRIQMALMNENWLRFEAQLGLQLQVGEPTLGMVRQAHLTQTMQLANRFQYLEGVGRGLEWLGRAALPLEVGAGILETGVKLNAAPPEEREHVLYQQVGKVGGEIIGGSFGGFLGTTAGIPGGPIAMFAGGVSIGVLGAATGARLGQDFTESAYQYHQIIDSALKTSVMTFFPAPIQPMIERELHFMSEYFQPSSRGGSKW